MRRDAILDDNGVLVEAGHKVRWHDVRGQSFGDVEWDARYSDNLRIGSRSLREIYDESDSMTIVS